MNLNKIIETHLLKRSLLSYALYPVGLLYQLAQLVHRNIYTKSAYTAPVKVISIGNIVSGGSGKTPLTIALACLLQDRGVKVAVSHRGYKGGFEHIPTIISEGEEVLYPASQTGDEAFLIASELPGIPVVVGRNRKAAIELLLTRFPATEVVIMDDALQHIKVHRDLDIVSFSVETGIGNGFVLPAGYLREPLSAIPSNSLVVINRRSDTLTEAPWSKVLTRKGIKVFGSSSTATGCIDAQGNRKELKSLKGKSLILISGIANPASFEHTVNHLGLPASKHLAFPDHHAFVSFTPEQKELLTKAEVILCTRKDIMKLAEHRELVDRLLALELSYRFDEPNEFAMAVLAYLK